MLRVAGFLTRLGLLLAFAVAATAHPGGSIVVDGQGQVYFVDTGGGVWKIDKQGKLALIHKVAYHWMALDEKGHFARSTALGDFDGGSFERITPAGSTPTLIISSDYPIAVGMDGGLYYVPYNRDGPRQLVRRMPNGKKEAVAKLPTDAGVKPMMWVNGIATGPDGSLYVTDNDAVLRIDRSGTVSTFRDAITVADCGDPLPDVPKLPYLRGLAVASDGTIHAAANGCRSVIEIPARGPIKSVLRSERPWSPTGVARSGNEIFVLEYLHTPGEDRKEWIPRIRRVGADGKTVTLATVTR